MKNFSSYNEQVNNSPFYCIQMKTIIKQKFICVLVTVTIMFFILPGTSFGQLILDKESTWEYGIKGGLSFSNYTNSSIDYTDGLMLGAVVVYRIPGLPLGIQPEVLYFERGGNRFAVEFKTHYIDVPVLFKLYLPFEAGLEFRPFVGPYIGFPLDGELREASRKTDISDQLNTDFGGVTGLGIKLNAGRFDLVFEGRYSLAFNKAFDQLGTLENSRNSSFAIAIELFF